MADISYRMPRLGSSSEGVLFLIIHLSGHGLIYTSGAGTEREREREHEPMEAMLNSSKG